jgi:hypothetical protein
MDPIQKIPFQILLHENVKKELESLYPTSYEKSFSRFIESIITLGIQEYKFQDKGVGFK